MYVRRWQLKTEMCEDIGRQWHDKPSASFWMIGTHIRVKPSLGSLMGSFDTVMLYQTYNL